jgi:hypothetical protein
MALLPVFTIEEAKREAEAEAQMRGHVLEGWARPSNAGAWYACCRRCDLVFYIVPEPGQFIVEAPARPCREP